MSAPRPRAPSTRQQWLRAGAALAATAAGVTAAWTALVHCDQSSTTLTYTPITGIQISAASLTAGHGCSNDPNDPNAVYRYSAVLSYVYEGGIAPPLDTTYNTPYAGVFECFSDGFFENIPVLDGGNQAFSIAIAAWNVAGFPASLDPCIAEPDGSANPGDLCPAERPPDVLDGGGVPPQWTTTCTAYMQPSIPGIAACAPLVPFDGGIPAADAGGNDGAAALEGSTAGADATDATTPAGDAADAADAADATAPPADAADAASPAVDASSGD